jgi:hypothetical protein
MSNRQLLELAAKAAGVTGLDFDYAEREGHGLYFGPRLPAPTGVVQAMNHTYWNPLDNDGDALRLAVKLGSTGRYPFLVSVGQVGTLAGDVGGPPTPHDQDPYAATRLAIVSAAAAIGGRTR